MCSTMVRIVILVGTILLLGSRLAETLSPQCRCRDRTAKSSRFNNLTRNCELTPTQETVEKFKNLVKRQKIFILLNITFTASNCDRQISNSQKDCNDTDDSIHEALFPYHWTWVYKGENGMFPLMEYPYDYNIHSLWSLNIAKVTLDAVLTIPDNCTVTMGNASLFRSVFWSLNNMAEKMMQPSWKGFLCYNMDNSESFSDFKLLIHHYFGFVRGITVKYCCPLQKEIKIDGDQMETDEYQMETDEDQMKLQETGGGYKLCPSGAVVQTTMLMNLTTILGVVNFIFLPFILCFLLKEEHLFESVPPDATHQWVNTSDGVFSFQHLMRWISWWDHPSLTASRIRRISFIILSPFIVYYHILAEYFCMQDVQNEYIKRDIPLGVKSIVFGFWPNYNNTYGFLGGTMTWGSIYFIITNILICLPNNVGNAIIGNLNIQKKSPFTFLILDADTLKKYSSVDINGHTNYQLAFKTLKANLLMVLNSKFWLAIFVVWKDRIKNIWTVKNECISIILFDLVVNTCIMSIYICLFLIEVLICFFYYGFPVVFTFISINVNIYDKIGCFWLDKMSERFHRVQGMFFWAMFVFSISIASCILLCTFFLVFYICLCSFFVLNLTIMFTIIGIIITPEIIGYLAYLLSAMFYINIIYQSFTSKYDALLKLVAKTPSIYVVSVKKIQFIRQDIFYEIVEHMRPLRSEMFLLLSKYFGLFLYLSMSYNIIREYQLSLQSTEKILSCILITQIPKIAINTLSQITSNGYQHEFNEQKKVKKFLKKYENNLDEI